MKTLALAMTLGVAACGSSPPPKKVIPTCDAGFCGTICCATGEECMTNKAGDPVCVTPCTLPTDCTEADAGCCMPVVVSGSYSGKSICSSAPSPSTAYTCTCGPNTGCGSNTMECVPLNSTSGSISGPYVCLPNDGQNHDGCGMPPYKCSNTSLFCSTDQTGDRFCSTSCMGDSDCKNTSVACCNATCSAESGMCCGLCGH